MVWYQLFCNTAANQTALLSTVNNATARWTKVAPYLASKALGMRPIRRLGINVTSTDVGCQTGDAAICKHFELWYMNVDSTHCGVD